MRQNTAAANPNRTHEGAPAAPRIRPEEQLRRSVLSCLLWEREFYEDGQAIADRILATIPLCKPSMVADLAVEARGQHNLRHVPLLLLCGLAKYGAGTSLVSDTISSVISRADELSELLAIYWKDGKKPLSAQMKKGLAKAFTKFNAYGLAKYNRDNDVKLRDVLFLCHAKPKDAEQAAVWKQLVDGTLPAPDTWEVGLSAGGDKKETFERLIMEGNLGYLALLRNLRNMAESGVDMLMVNDAILARKGAHRVFPFRYYAAARACPQMEPALDKALLASLEDAQPFDGKTVVLVDVSYSMMAKLSVRSDMTRMTAAAALGSIIKGNQRVFTFSNRVVEVPPRKGMAGADAIINSQQNSGTRLGQAVQGINESIPHDRLIVITDEQSHDRVPDPVCDKAYMINVASNENGVGYGKWTHIDGFSEQVLRFIHEIEGAG